MSTVKYNQKNVVQRSKRMDIMEINKHFEAIENIITDAIEKFDDNVELKEKKEQLRTIKRSIKQLEKKGVSVPQEMKDLKLNLLRNIEEIESPKDDLLVSYNRALDITTRLAQLCGQSLWKDIYQKAREKKANTLDVDILSEALITVLEGMGGSGHEKDIFPRVERALQTKLSETDRECPKGRTPRWHTNLRRARKKLVNSNVLTPDSIKRIWSLQE